MNKPITIIREEFKQSLASVINESCLPAFVIEPILQDYLVEIRMAVQKQYEIDKKIFEEAQKNKETNCNTESAELSK